MHILAFSHYFPPEVNAPANRLFEHARTWIKLGHTVTVITCAPNHPTGKLYPGYKNRFIQEENLEGVRVIRVWTWLAANKGFGNRIINYISFMFSSALALKKISQVDVVISSTPQFFCGLVGFYARWKISVPWVLEVRDLWPESIISVGAMKYGISIKALEILESWAYRKADKVVTVSEGFVNHIVKRRGIDDLIVIKNGVDLDKFKRTGNQLNRFSNLDLEGKTVVSYIGTHGLAQGLDTILEAAQILKDEKDIIFLMAGDGADWERLKKKSEDLQLQNLHLIGQIERNKIETIWLATSISVVLLRKNDSFKAAIPSKIFEAMAMECPIVLGVEGEAAALLTKANGGTTIAPENAAELANSIIRYAKNSKLAKMHGKNGRQFVENNFDRNVLAVKYLEVLENLR